MDVTQFSTARLDARAVDPEDEAFVCTLFTDERVSANLGGARDAARVHQDIERWRAHWLDHGFGLWIVRDRATGEPIGWTMLHVTDTGGTGGVEVGWTIVADRWREGLGYEAGAGATRVGFETLGLDEIVSFTQPHNAASRGVMRKMGFVYDCDIVHADLPHVLYRLDRETWKRSMGEQSRG